MHPRKPMIYGPDGKPLVRVNDRLAPKPRASAGLEGWVEWGLIDRKGNKVRGGEQHNLILNTFLDWVAINNYTYGLYPSFQNAVLYYAAGTGSTPPSVSDTALDNELGRTAVQVGTQTITRTSDGVYEFVVEREFDFAVANGNLTEFGFAPGVSSDLIVRELFRDSGGNPITITKTSDYKLRIKYTHILTLTSTFPNLTPHSFAISGLGTIDCEVGWLGGGTSGIGAVADYVAFSCVAAGKATAGSYPYGRAGVSSGVPSAYSNTLSFALANQADTQTPSSYTPGSFERTSDVILGTTRGNLNIATLGIAGSSNGTGTGYMGLVCVIDPGDRFTKDSLHTLSLDEFMTVSWGRA